MSLKPRRDIGRSGGGSGYGGGAGMGGGAGGGTSPSSITGSDRILLRLLDGALSALDPPLEQMLAQVWGVGQGSERHDE